MRYHKKHLTNIDSKNLMKKLFKIFSPIFISYSILFSKDWINTGTSSPSNPNWKINTSSEDNIEISFELNGYFIEKKDGGSQITLPGGVPILQSGAPELPRMTHSVIIPDLAKMEISILSSKYYEFPIENILPSKGNVTRDVDPKTIPYFYGEIYDLDAWYPENISFLRDPYILRSFRGQTVVFQPFQFNPQRKVIRVYTNIKVGIRKNGESQINPLTNRPPGLNSREF